MSKLRALLTLTTIARLAVAAALLFTLHQLGAMKHPSKTAWARHWSSDHGPSYREHVNAGLWYGGIARAGLCGTLLLVSLGWSWRGARGGREPIIRLRSLGVPMQGLPDHRAWSAALIAISIAALAMRLPRMTHSFWGDEADAVASYIQGMWWPVQPGDTQGELHFGKPEWGETLFAARHGPNNHVLFSIISRACLELWRVLTHHAPHEFTEWVVRVPSLAAGMASLLAFALLLRRWGAPWLGLLAVMFMALHPWHVRYSAEARGYALVLLLIPLFLHALTSALEHNRWRSWMLLALLEFLLMWSWPGIAYGLAGLNISALILCLAQSDRWPRLIRFTTAHLIAATAFISLHAPHVPQIIWFSQHSGWIKGWPMDNIWAHNVLISPFTGILWHGRDPENPVLLSWENFLDRSPVLALGSLLLMAVVFAAGLCTLWRRSRPIAALATGVFVGAVACVLHFKFVLDWEARTWYLLFTLPMLAVTMAAGLQALASLSPRTSGTPRAQALTTLLLGGLMTCFWWEADISEMRTPFEDYKGIVSLTREQHESFSPHGPSRIFTAWLLRHHGLYDPRNITRIQSGAALRAEMETVRSIHGDLYYIVGYREMAERDFKDVLNVLDDPALFEKVKTFWSRQHYTSLAVYHMKP